MKHMPEMGIRALKQNASAVVAEAASGTTVTITDRGRPVAQLRPVPTSRLAGLIASGRARPARRHRVTCLGPPELGRVSPLSLRRCGPTSGTEPNISNVAYYVDTSALVKVVVEEQETSALMNWLIQQDAPLSAATWPVPNSFVPHVDAPDRVLRARQVLEA